MKKFVATVRLGRWIGYVVATKKQLMYIMSVYNE
jgi:hypothetical protein